MARTSNTSGRTPARDTAASKLKPAAPASRAPSAQITKAARPHTARVSRQVKPTAEPASAGMRQGRQRQTAVPAAAPPPATQASTLGNKQQQVLSMLRRLQGATVAELMQTTGWMSHSVRGLFSAIVKRKLGLELASVIEQGRGRVYRVPGETTAPLAAPPPARQRKVSRAIGRLVASTAGAAG